jgi:hypothetical protein
VIFRLLMGAGFIVLAVLVLLFGNAGLFFGWFGFVVVLLILGVALIVAAYLEPKLSGKKSTES